MKTNYAKMYTLAGALLFSLASMGQITITQWNFNGATASTVPGGTSSPAPSIGAGSAGLVGGVTPVSPATDFSSGASSGGSSDPVVTTPNTNFAWGTTAYAALGAENKQRGVQFNVSTANYSGITFKFDQRLSNTTSNTWVVQYTTNRLAANPVWVDAQTFTFTPAPTGTGDTWYNQRSVDLSAVTALNNNDVAAFRIVEAFDPVLNDYTAATSTSTYGTGGTSRFDMVTVIAAASLATPQHAAQDDRVLDLFAEELRLAHESLTAITGKFTSDDLLGEIFSSFCIGK